MSSDSFEYRPWGRWKVVEEHDNYKIKTITVNPYQRLSLQIHYKRFEHWIVVKGEATIIKNDNEFLLKECESTDIPPNTPHRLSNKSSEPITIIEIQYGICNENDIVRIEDDYGRI